MDMGEQHDRVLQLVTEMLLSGSKPLEVAAVLGTTALRIYRTVLSDADYDRMVDTLSDSRDQVEAIGRTGTLQ